MGFCWALKHSLFQFLTKLPIKGNHWLIDIDIFCHFSELFAPFLHHVHGRSNLYIYQLSQGWHCHKNECFLQSNKVCFRAWLSICCCTSEASSQKILYDGSWTNPLSIKIPRKQQTSLLPICTQPTAFVSIAYAFIICAIKSFIYYQKTVQKFAHDSS